MSKVVSANIIRGNPSYGTRDEVQLIDEYGGITSNIPVGTAVSANVVGDRVVIVKQECGQVIQEVWDANSVTQISVTRLS